MSAERGWISDPPHPSLPPERRPSEQHKWRLMMGRGSYFWKNGQLCMKPKAGTDK